MYENLIQPTPISNKPNNLSVRLGTMPVNEKVAYVESVCAALIDARFGRRWNPFIIDMGDWPEDEDAGFCEMNDEVDVPNYVVLPDSEMARSYATDDVGRELARAALTRAGMRDQTLPASNLGRGSPKISGTHRRVGPTCDPAVSVPPAVAGGWPYRTQTNDPWDAYKRLSHDSANRSIFENQRYFGTHAASSLI